MSVQCFTQYSPITRLLLWLIHHVEHLTCIRLCLCQASKGNTALLQLLLKHSAKANAKDSTGSTPLHRAASANKAEAVKMLVEQGKANMEAKDKTGATPLFVAVDCRHANIAVYLASKGASLEVRPAKPVFSSFVLVNSCYTLPHEHVASWDWSSLNQCHEGQLRLADPIHMVQGCPDCMQHIASTRLHLKGYWRAAGC